MTTASQELQAFWEAGIDDWGMFHEAINAMDEDYTDEDLVAKLYDLGVADWVGYSYSRDLLYDMNQYWLMIDENDNGIDDFDEDEDW